MPCRQFSVRRREKKGGLKKYYPSCPGERKDGDRRRSGDEEMRMEGSAAIIANQVKTNEGIR